MRLERQGWVFVALGALFIVGSALPWLGDDTAWSSRFAPLVFVVHIPVVIAIALLTLRETGAVKWQLPVLSDRKWLEVTAIFAVVGALSSVLLQRLVHQTYSAGPLGVSSQPEAAGAGAFVTLAAAIVLFVVVFFGQRFSLLRPAAANVDAGAWWISLGTAYASPDGAVLQPDEWYLAFDDAGTVVVQLDNGAEIALPPGFPFGEAPQD